MVAHEKQIHELIEETGKVLENVRELKEHTFRTVSLRSPEHPSVNEKILKWIGNANMFQDTLEKTIAEIKKDAI